MPITLETLIADFSLAYTVAGFIVGFTVGLTGVGGGSLMTPILVFFFGIKPALAVGTDLLYAALTKCGGIYVHHKQGSIQWPIVRLLVLGCIPASLLTIGALRQLQAHQVDFNHLLTTTLGVALILTSLAILGKNTVLEWSQHERFDFIRKLHGPYLPHLTLLAGALLGTLVTLSSVGAGALGTTILFFLYPKLSAVAIVGSDLAYAVPLTFVAGMGHLSMGSVDLTLLLSLLAGSLPGIYLGSHLGFRLPDRFVRTTLAVMLFGIGIRFIT
jgi:hypothetical protein